MASGPVASNHATHSTTGKSLYSVASTRTFSPVPGSVPSKTVSIRLASIRRLVIVGCHASGMPRMALPPRTKEIGRSAALAKKRPAPSRLRAISSGVVISIVCVALMWPPIANPVVSLGHRSTGDSGRNASRARVRTTMPTFGPRANCSRFAMPIMRASVGTWPLQVARQGGHCEASPSGAYTEEGGIT